MNPYLTELLDLVNAKRQKDGLEVLERDALIKALHLVSAPYLLAAVVLYCERLTHIVDQNPGFKNLPIPDLEMRLGILQEISNLSGAREHFLCSQKPSGSATPLHPYTGDGPACDVLLIEANNESDQPQYKMLTIWFVWVCIRYHHEKLTSSEYAEKLDGDPPKSKSEGKVEASDKRRLAAMKFGKRIAIAGYQIRRLAGDSDEAKEERAALVELELELNEDRGQYLGLLADHANRAAELTPRDIQKWSDYSHLDYAAAETQLITMRKVHTSIRFILRLIWVQGTRGYVSPRTRQLNAERKFRSLEVHRYGKLRGHVSIDASGGSDAGLIVDIDKQPSSPKRKTKPSDDEVVDHSEDKDDPGTDPLFRLYIGKRCDDHVGSYYAAKGVQYVVEYQNAQLPWSKDRVSRQGLVDLVRRLQPDDDDGEADLGGKLLVLLSLITGRSLKEVKTGQIELPGKSSKGDASLVISIRDRRLRLKAATPNLKKIDHGRRDTRITHDMAEFIEVTLPDSVAKLVNTGQWLGDKPLNRLAYEKAAKKLVLALPEEFGIKLASIRAALVFELLQLSRGDLGIVKLVTNHHGLNYDNIIHYASYPESYASGAWSMGIERVLDAGSDPLPLARVGRSDEKYVGTPDSIDASVLKKHLAKLQTQLNKRLAESDWVRAYNLLTLYTLLWLNLGTASRARVHPAPVSLVGNIAVISDKHREDDSAERLLPLSEDLLAQLRAYFAYVWHLAFREPQLQPVADAFESGVLNFQFINAKGEIVGYRPKWLYEIEALIPMPGNWARKLLRTELTSIGGRFLDACMGHWADGRHPYRITSTFACGEANRKWLERQRELEAELGFKLIAHPQLTEPPFEWPLVYELKRPPAKKKDKTDAKQELQIDFEAECIEANETLYDAICEAKEKVPAAAAELILKIVEKYSADEKYAHEIAKASCTQARKKWRVPVFVERPRRQFQQDWLINRVALHNLGYFTARVLPGFYSDLEYLPQPEDLLCADKLDIGRFIMLLIWRQGLVTWPLLDAFVVSYLTNGILATGLLRYVPTGIRCRRNGAPMSRLNFLEPYSQIYLVTEHARLKAGFAPLMALNPKQRRAKVQSALVAYLRTLADFNIGNMLTTTFKAAQQYHMLNSSPVLAAYASAEFETHDLPDDEIRHLAGYESRARTTSDSAQVLSVEGGLGKENVALPSKVIPGNRDIVHLIAYKQAANRQAIVDRINEIKTRTPIEQLISVYAVWLMKREIKALDNKVSRQEKARFAGLVEIVGYSLMGFGYSEADTLAIDEAVLANLEDQFADLHPNVDSADAFNAFRRFLRQKTGRTSLEKLGFILGDIEPATPRKVLAKIVATDRVQQVRHGLDSVLASGIGKPQYRMAAKRHLDCIDLLGLRRSEAERIREKDVQDNLIRVQPYGAHTLKTAWSNRTLPRSLMDMAGMDWVGEINESNENQMIAHGIQDSVNGHNYYDAINKLMQERTADPEIHLHILRHSVASRLMLSMLSLSVDYSLIQAQFPWLSEFLAPDAHIDELLGGEGQGGHGLQAISALLGHSHPTTTLRYYIHTVGVAFYAYLCGLQTIPMIKSFEFRLGSSRTMQRRINTWRKANQSLGESEVAALVFEQLRLEAESLNQGVVSKEENRHIVPQPIGPEVEADDPPETVDVDSRAISFERFELLEQILRDEAPDDGIYDLRKIKAALRKIAEIPTGKLGSKVKRHPMELFEGDYLPQRLPAKSPTQSAALVCDWLDVLRTKHPEELTWVMQKWLHASEKEFGRIRLSQEEIERWCALPAQEQLRAVIEQKKFSNSKTQIKRNPITVNFGRIRCLMTDGQPMRRDVSGVRWAMTWTCALYSGMV